MSRTFAHGRTGAAEAPRTAAVPARSREDHPAPFPYAVLRMAGFPFDWLDELAEGSAAASAARLVGMRRADGGGEAEEAESECRTAYDAETARTACAVFRRFRDEPGLRGMLLISSREVYETLCGWFDQPGVDPMARSRDRKRLGTLVRYLQRVCAKNDTTSHFGPVGLALFDSSRQGIAWSRRSLRRFPRVSRWAAEALADAIGRDPRVAPTLRPRRRAAADLRESTVRRLELDYGLRRVADVREVLRPQAPLTLDDVDAALVQACTGTRTVAEIADDLRAAGRELTTEEAVTRLRGLERRGIVVVGPELPYGVADPVPALRAAVGDREDAVDWHGRLDSFERHVAAFARGDTRARHTALAALEREFTAATGAPPRRAPGTTYGDRMVVNEHCLAPVDDVRIGAPALDVLRADVHRVCALMLLRPRRRFEAERRLLTGWYERTFGGREAPMLEYLEAFLADVEGPRLDYAPVDAEVAEVDRAVDAVLLGGWDGGHVHRVTGAAVDAFLTANASPTPAICNPDVMLVRPSSANGDAEPAAVVGEVHFSGEGLSHGGFAPFLERRFPGFADDVVAEYRRLLAPDEELVDVTQVHRNFTWARALLPIRDVEGAERSPARRDRVVPLAALLVSPAREGLRLRTPGGGSFLRLKASPLAWCGVYRNPFGVFGFPAGAGGLPVQGRARAHLPRIQVGRAVVQRERWRVPTETFAGRDGFEEFVAVQAVRERLELPRRVYARIPGEVKPIYCDLDSPLLVRQLTRFAARTPGEVELTEMLPTPDLLWLRDERGAYTCELRYTAFHAATGTNA